MNGRAFEHTRLVVSLLPSCLRAAWELALARLRHQFIKPGDLEALNRRAGQLASSGAPVGRLAADRARCTERIAFVLPRIAARMPWRADCLVQAMAAQHWLSAIGVPATITIGVRRGEAGSFESHAWLLSGDQVITGGDVAGFSPILTPREGLTAEGAE